LLAGVVRRQISLEYVSHYLNAQGGEIPIGVAAALSFFDEALGGDDPYYDVAVLSAVLRAAGLSDLLDAWWSDRRDLWQELLDMRGEAIHDQVLRQVHWITAALKLAAEASRFPRTQLRSRDFCIASIRKATEQEASDQPPANARELLHRAANGLAGTIRRMKETWQLKPFFDATASVAEAPSTDVLFVTATEVETLALLKAFGLAPGDVTREPLGARVSYELGTHQGTRFAAIQSEVGPGGAGGSTLTVDAAIRALRPTFVIAVGIAFGVNEAKQRIGDVLVSQHLKTYEQQRIGSTDKGELKIVDRGVKVPPSATLLGRLRDAALDWAGTVRFGTMLTGEKLIDHVDFRDSLLAIEPEAIGGEMEGAGLYAAADLAKKDWIIVKGLCDWGSNKATNKTARQKKAAKNAAEFVAHAALNGRLQP
jgi:nucleoside phosphorylase